MIPLRACGGNVLLRRVSMDVHRSSLLILGGQSNNVLQMGEVVGLGGRWTQNRPWFPPAPTPHRAPLDNGKWDPDWKAPDLTFRARPKPARFDAGHEEWLRDLKVGDLVIYIQARIYDVFQHDGQDIIVYPGDWIQAVVEDSTLSDPARRRYEKDDYSDPTPPRNPHGPA